MKSRFAKPRYALTLLLVSAACSNGEPGTLPRPATTAGVTVSAPGRASSSRWVPARLEAGRTARVATRISGTVIAVNADIGARVRAGTPLVVLDDADVQARIRAARAAETLARRDFERIRSLAADGAASRHELDQVRVELERAAAARSAAEAQERYVRVRAPFDGVVTRRDVDPGDLAMLGRPLLTVEASGRLKVVAELPAGRAGQIVPGQRVVVRAGTGPTVLTARVTRVVPALGPRNRSFRVEAEPDSAAVGLLPGTYARMGIPAEGSGSRWIPQDAVVRRGQLTGVFTVEADTLRLRWVRLGAARAGAVELLAGPVG